MVDWYAYCYSHPMLSVVSRAMHGMTAVDQARIAGGMSL
jgi:hypothetical protein